ncbi:MFS transporter [Ideonella sp. BN130291]|uniref:MFS transporter n=1 Tax=Ideonella sp. BN130291 TaxID=3112940 RepID=UPI002E252A18|nr:MFS transporter [Ideonella sp. BN130291]
MTDLFHRAPGATGPRAIRSAWAAIAALFFANGAAFATWVSNIPDVRDALSLDEAQLGSALFAMALGALLAFPLAGRGCRVLGAREVTMGSALALAFLLPHPAWVGLPSSLALSLFALGAANGAMDVAMNALAADLQARAGRPIMSRLHGMWSAGGLAGAGLGALAHRLDMPPAWHLLAASGFVAATVWLARRFLPRLVVDAAPPAPRAPVHAPRAMAGLAVIVFCAFLIEGAAADWSAVFLHHTLGQSTSVAALGYAAFSLTMTAMRLAGDAVVARLGPSRPLRACNALAAVALAAALLTGQVPLVFLALALVGLAVAIVAPLVFAAAAQRSPHSAGEGIALMAGAGYGGFLLGPPCIGWLAHAIGLQAALGLLVLLLTLIALLSHQLRQRPHAACAADTPAGGACHQP